MLEVTYASGTVDYVDSRDGIKCDGCWTEDGPFHVCRDEDGVELGRYREVDRYSFRVIDDCDHTHYLSVWACDAADAEDVLGFMHPDICDSAISIDLA